MSIGALCGKAELMDLTDPGLQKGAKAPIAGTFTTNPISMVAAVDKSSNELKYSE